MKTEFRAHPLMVLSLTKPFWFILLLPVIKGVVQYIFYRTVTGVLLAEIIAFSAIVTVAGARCYAFRLICDKNSVTVKSGVLFKTKAVIPINRLSSVQSLQNPLEAVFRAVTFRINTEAGVTGKADFEFKLSVCDSHKVSEMLYGSKKPAAVKFSVIKIAVMAATTSSATMGIIIGVPIINNAGKLLGLALNEILMDEINNVSGKFAAYFPPIVNTVTLILLLGYAVAFFYSLLKYINFRLYLGKDKIEVRSGFFVRSRISFKKSSVNDVKVEQTPLMRFFGRYALKVSVGGYNSETKSESAVVVPSGRRGEIKQQFSIYFPFLAPDGKLLHAKRGPSARNRFLYWPKVYLIITVGVSFTLALLFENFGKLILFLTAITFGIIFYYAHLCIYEYRFGKARLGENIFAQSVKGFRTCELYCPKENVGEIKLIRALPDIRNNTCKLLISVRSESADSIKVRHLNYSEVKTEIFNCYGINLE